MKKFITNKYVLTILGIILFFLLWWMISAIVGNGNRIFPDPWSTIAYSFNLLKDEYIYLCLGYSLMRMIVGFVIAALLGILLGAIVGNTGKVKHVFNPTMVALKAVPTAAVVYLFMVLMGAKNAPIAIVALITFPIIYEATVGGYSSIPLAIQQSVRLEGKGLLNKNARVLFPMAMPYVIVGLLSSFALSFKIEIMSEVISGSTSYGLGTAIRTAQAENPADMLPVFGYSLFAIILMLLITGLISLLKKKNFSRL